MTPPSPSTGSSRMSPTSSTRRRAQRRRCRSAARSARPAAAARTPRASPAGPVTASAPVVRPWKLCSSAITPGLPVALRAYLSAASFASVPELQKNACAPPNVADSACASAARGLGPEEVRRVPEPVELRVRSGERRRMPVAERDDGDAGGEVEIARGRGRRSSQHAVAVDERDARRRIRREQRVLERDAHATTAVTPISATRPLARCAAPRRAASGRSRPRRARRRRASRARVRR